MFPEIKLSDSIVLPTYLLFLSLLYCFLIFYAVRRAHKHDESTAVTLDLALILMVFGFIGGRLTHVFYEMPASYARDLSLIFKFWQGGFVFYGGFLLALAACLVYLRVQKLSFLKWADFYTPIGALGYGLGRISCYLAGCCYGRECTAPWAVVFPWDQQQIARHPTQIYAVLWELSVYAILIFLEHKKVGARRPGTLFFIWMVFHSLGRMMMEFYRDDFRGQVVLNMSFSTWISLMLLSLSLGFLISGLLTKSKSRN